MTSMDKNFTGHVLDYLFQFNYPLARVYSFNEFFFFFARRPPHLKIRAMRTDRIWQSNLPTNNVDLIHTWDVLLDH